ncbi:hypothetical protein [Effusibacillus consociatus]|uniref:Uncharacterized protein n=1 Tax=Effusibacillus consociatus TaxID=1117041 RepID=A0ABV9Q3C8_9BACL
MNAEGVAISIALLECFAEELPGQSPEMLTKRVVELKKLAKAQVGSVYIKGTLGD